MSGGNTNTSGSLWLMMDQVFTEENGDRPDVPNIAIMVTDGKATWDTQFTIPYAEEARAKGIEVCKKGKRDPFLQKMKTYTSTCKM